MGARCHHLNIIVDVYVFPMDKFFLVSLRPTVVGMPFCGLLLACTGCEPTAVRDSSSPASAATQPTDHDRSSPASDVPQPAGVTGAVLPRLNREDRPLVQHSAGHLRMVAVLQEILDQSDENIMWVPLRRARFATTRGTCRRKCLWRINGESIMRSVMPN